MNGILYQFGVFLLGLGCSIQCIQVIRFRNRNDNGRKNASIRFWQFMGTMISILAGVLLYKPLHDQLIVEYGIAFESVPGWLFIVMIISTGITLSLIPVLAANTLKVDHSKGFEDKNIARQVERIYGDKDD